MHGIVHFSCPQPSHIYPIGLISWQGIDDIHPPINDQTSVLQKLATLSPFRLGLLLLGLLLAGLFLIEFLRMILLGLSVLLGSFLLLGFLIKVSSISAVGSEIQFIR
jgi:hypothetical protein